MKLKNSSPRHPIQSEHLLLGTILYSAHMQLVAIEHLFMLFLYKNMSPNIFSSLHGWYAHELIRASFLFSLTKLHEKKNLRAAKMQSYSMNQTISCSKKQNPCFAFHR